MDPIAPPVRVPAETVDLSASVGAPYLVEAGSPHPLGATVDATGVNFSVFSEHATFIELLLFDNDDSAEPFQTVKLSAAMHRTFHFWHCHIRDLPAGTQYAYRVDGPWDPHGRGFRFNPNKVVIDPYAKGITTSLWDRGAACTPDDNVGQSMRGVVLDISDYDWEGDTPLNRPMSETIVYEMHVGGFTKSPTASVTNPGTFSGIHEKIPYLKALGVTAVELLPIHQFDPKEIEKPSPADPNVMLTNYWGYSTVGFFATHNAYRSSPDFKEGLTEFRDMVKALHKEGIEVILDVVFNHTSEGNHQGPVINFKGFQNDVYYHLVEQDRQYYMDYTGCGNTVNCNHPLVDKFIVECLEYWVREYHIDGFRFDEGSILSRGEDGAPMVHPPVVWHIELSEELADTKVFAEAWDAAGLYQIGYFPGYRWAEWNGRYRDDVRRFVKGDGGLISAIASRIAGSSDIYQSSGHLPINSVNFINCHDGFTLNDLVSYNDKHNDANGEGNRDGNDSNDSWNCGWEGPTDDAGIERFREQQIRNFATILMLSQGVPMFVAGDEVRRTQHGNNNAYCQDTPLSWLDWSLTEKNGHLLRYFQQMIAFRKRHPIVHRSRFFTGETNERLLPDVAWHGCELNAPGWNDPNSRILAYTMGGFGTDPDLHVMLNMDGSALPFELPIVHGRRWYRVVDTSLPSPEDIAEDGQEVAIADGAYIVNSHSVVVLISR
ncbi:MAG: glycogen debranching protein GlgX [Chloroflexi bacterium]|nr:glycogen debranching protein GlgX [Chloroflexota bacterium]